jgi:hypothetical protein
VGLRPCRSAVRLQGEIISHIVQPDPNLVETFRSDSVDESGGDISNLIINAYAPDGATLMDGVQTLVVHCYGVGGGGYTIGPGLAKDAVESIVGPYLFRNLTEEERAAFLEQQLG